MNKRVLLTLVVLVPLVSACCGIPEISDLIPVSGEMLRGSGDVVTQEFDLTRFDTVDVSHAFTVDIREGDSFSVVVGIDDNLAEYLRVEKQGSTVRIGLDTCRNYVFAHGTAEVTMSELTGLELSRASIATVNASGRLDVDASGASQVKYLGSPTLGTIDLSGGSSIEPR